MPVLTSYRAPSGRIFKHTFHMWLPSGLPPCIPTLRSELVPIVACVWLSRACTTHKHPSQMAVSVHLSLPPWPPRLRSSAAEP